MKRLIFAGLTTTFLFFNVATIPAVALNTRFSTARQQTLSKITAGNDRSCGTAQNLQFDPECKG
jgi:hypothetical protein